MLLQYHPTHGCIMLTLKLVYSITMLCLEGMMYCNLCLINIS